MKIIDSQQKDIVAELKRIINRPARGIGETTLTKLKDCAITQGTSMWTVLNDPLAFGLNVNSGTARKLQLFRELIQGFVNDMEEVSAFDLADSVIKKTGLLTEMYADRTPESLSKQENIQELLNGIQEFCLNKQEEGIELAGLVDFLSEISLATDQDTDKEAEQERVTMMTIHAAKGLEFKNVFVVGMEEDLFPSTFAKESEKSLEEERRLFYVAITRAGENCVLSFAKSRFRHGQSQMCSPSRFLKDIDAEYLDLPTDNRMADAVRERAANFNRNNFSGRGIPERPSASSYAQNNFTPKTQPTRQPDIPNNPYQTQSVDNVAAGQSIRHERFGVGKITKCEGTGDDRKIFVSFEHSGDRVLLLKYAKFTIL